MASQKPETKPQWFKREREALMFEIAQKWSLALALAEAIDRPLPPLPREWEAYWRIPGYAEAVYSGDRQALWLEAIDQVHEVDTGIRNFCAAWELGTRGYDRVWFMYRTWRSHGRARHLPTFVVGGRPQVAEAEAGPLLDSAVDATRAEDSQWQSHTLRRRDGAGRKPGSGRYYSDSEFMSEYPAAFKRVRQRNLGNDESEPPTILEVANEMTYPMSEATFYRYLKKTGASYPPHAFE